MRKNQNEPVKSYTGKMLDTGKPASALISESDMGGVNEDTLTAFCEQAISEHQSAVSDYLSGKEKALKAILGAVMKATRGRADAVQAEQLLIRLIRK